MVRHQKECEMKIVFPLCLPAPHCLGLKGTIINFWISFHRYFMQIESYMYRYTGEPVM